MDSVINKPQKDCGIYLIETQRPQISPLFVWFSECYLLHFLSASSVTSRQTDESVYFYITKNP